MLSENVHETKSHSYLVMLLCAIAALVAAAVLYNPIRGRSEQFKRAGVDPSESKPLLDVKMEGQYLYVVWNRHAPIVEKAGRGVLSIRDGSQLESIPLSAGQLREANGIVYSPSTDVIDIQLEITGPNIQKQSQSVPFILGQMQPTPASEPAERPPIEAKALDDGLSAHPLYPPSRLTPLVSIRQPPGKGIHSASYIQPSPLKEIRPTVSSQLEPMLRSPIEIDVKVTIDARGKVVRAKPISQAGSLRGSQAQRTLLIHALLDAAMRSRFRPAQIRSKSVLSELVLAFRFSGHG